MVNGGGTKWWVPEVLRDEPEATGEQALRVDQPAPNPYGKPVPVVHADVVKLPSVGIGCQAHLAAPTPDDLPYPPAGV